MKELLGYASITTTVDTYGHLTVEDARRTLEARDGSPAGRFGCDAASRLAVGCLGGSAGEAAGRG